MTYQLEAAPRKTRKVPMVVAVIVSALIGALLASFILAPAFWSGALIQLEGKADQLKCDAAAVKQLPRNAVRSVESVNSTSHIFPGEAKTLMTGSNGVGRQFEAFVYFEPHLCGFISNINGNAANEATDHSHGLLFSSKVIAIRHGEQLKGGAGICVSNILPDVRVIEDRMEMILYCDRSYPVTVLGQEAPDLSHELD